MSSRLEDLELVLGKDRRTEDKGQDRRTGDTTRAEDGQDTMKVNQQPIIYLFLFSNYF